MLVRDNPYFAVTDKSGKFEIKNVPAGVELEFRVWKEGINDVVDVTLNGSPTKWKKGKFKLTLDNDAEEEMNVEIDASLFKS